MTATPQLINAVTSFQRSLDMGKEDGEGIILAASECGYYSNLMKDVLEAFGSVDTRSEKLPDPAEVLTKDWVRQIVGDKRLHLYKIADEDLGDVFVSGRSSLEAYFAFGQKFGIEKMVKWLESRTMEQCRDTWEIVGVLGDDPADHDDLETLGVTDNEDGTWQVVANAVSWARWLGEAAVLDDHLKSAQYA